MLNLGKYAIEEADATNGADNKGGVNIYSNVRAGYAQPNAG
jgi:hypothetical protein